MRLSEKLTALRKSRGWSQEELAENLNVSRQSVSKWEAGQAAPELDKIVRMSELFGVSTDYLLKGNEEEAFAEEPSAPENEQATAGQTAAEPPLRHEISEEEAHAYLETVERARWKIALGVLFCILSPIPLLLLASYADAGRMPEDVGGAIGVAILLVFVAIGLVFIIPAGMQLSAFDYLEKQLLSLPSLTQNEIREKEKAYAPTFRLVITLGVVLCLLGVIPILVFGGLHVSNLAMIFTVCILLFLVAIAVFLFIYTGMRENAYQKLLCVGDYADARKTGGSIAKVQGVFWPLVVAVYLLLSFLTRKWSITWIIWPIAALLSAALNALFGAKED